MRALLVDQSRDRALVVGARALAAAGYRVGTGAPAKSFASMSRHVARHHAVREASADEDGFIGDIQTAVAAEGYDIVFCTYEAGILALSRRRDEIAPALWPYPDARSVARAFDKLDLFHAARAAGVPVPRTEAATPQALAAWNGPVIVKARNHVPSRFDTALFDSAAEARGLVERTIAEGGEPLLQEPLSGRMGAVVLVVGRDGSVIAEVHQEALRTWPPGAGDTVLGRVVPTDETSSAHVRGLAAELGWFGLTQVELFRGEDGVARITDFNGRFYGSMALAVSAGVNVPALWADEALGRPRPPAAPVPRPGATFQWLNRDLAAGAARGPRGLLAAIAAAPLAAHSMWDRRDPGPAVRYLLPEAARRAAGRLRSSG